MIFLDNASTTKPYLSVVDIMNDINKSSYYNPGALYRNGVELTENINKIRKNILSKLGAGERDNLYFTGSATESNNMAIRGILRKNCGKLLFSMSEHPSVYNLAMELKNEGYNVDFLKLNNDGTIDFEDVKKKVDKNTYFVSVMHVCNETGAINDIKSICDYVKSVNPKILVHSDGVQAFGKIDVNIMDLGVDLYTISAHKIHGPKGIGALFVKKNIILKPLIIGGGQEYGMRSGTENTANIFGFNEAVNITLNDMPKNYELIRTLKQEMLNNLNNKHIKFMYNGTDNNSPYIMSLSFDRIKSETLLYMLEDAGYLVSNGSACSTKKKGNRILTAMNISNDAIDSNIRVSFCAENTITEINNFCDALSKILQKYHNNTIKG